MTQLAESSLALFLTKGNSLDSWNEVGMLDREVDYYNRIAKHIQSLYVFSYGKDDSKKYQDRFEANVTVVDKSVGGSNFLYQFLLPFVHRNLLRRCRILKTNQLYAAVPALLTKLIQPSAKLIIRCGYVASLNAQLYHSSLFFRWYTKLLETFAFRLADLVFITTDELANYLSNHYRFVASKLKVLPNAINTDVFRPLPVEKRYDLGYVGRLEKDKNLKALLEAMVGLDLSICFIGQGPEKFALAELAKTRNISLTIIDRVDNNCLPEYYNAFRIFVFPSLHEGNPKTLLEAMACGLPVIGASVIGVHHLILHEKNGLRTDPSITDLRRTLQMLLSHSDLGERLGQEARRSILQEYAIGHVYQKELMTYKKLLY